MSNDAPCLLPKTPGKPDAANTDQQTVNNANCLREQREKQRNSDSKDDPCQFWKSAAAPKDECQADGAQREERQTQEYDGGGIENFGRVDASAIAINANTAKDSGGGIHKTGKLALTQTPPSGNSTSPFGGGLYNSFCPPPPGGHFALPH